MVQHDITLFRVASFHLVTRSSQQMFTEASYGSKQGRADALHILPHRIALYQTNNNDNDNVTTTTTTTTTNNNNDSYSNTISHRARRYKLAHLGTRSAAAFRLHNG